MKSRLHLETLFFLKKAFPGAYIIEEYSIKKDRKTTLFFDFFLQSLGLAVEAQGRQHDEFSSFFYGSRHLFLRQRKNDLFKAQYCKEVGITLIYTYYNEEITARLIRDKLFNALELEQEKPLGKEKGTGKE